MVWLFTLDAKTHIHWSATISLFGGVYWSKFSHMFFKPFAAYDKRIRKADGSAENLPPRYN
jgi:hypothetical protein